MIWHFDLSIIHLDQRESKEKEMITLLHSKNKSFFLLLKILNVYPLFFEINIQNLTPTLNEYYKERCRLYGLKNINCMYINISK